MNQTIQVLHKGRQTSLEVGTQIADTQGKGHKFEITEVNLEKNRVRFIGTGGKDKVTTQFIKYKFASGRWALHRGRRWSKRCLMRPKKIDYAGVRRLYSPE